MCLKVPGDYNRANDGVVGRYARIENVVRMHVFLIGADRRLDELYSGTEARVDGIVRVGRNCVRAGGPWSRYF